MERLTKRNSEGIAVLKQPYECERCGDRCWSLPDYGSGSPIDRLAEYEDLEEEGKLPRLACAVGDTVYEIREGFIEPCTVELIFIADYKDKEGNPSYMAEIYYNREECPWISTDIYLTDIGKTVFLTSKEAEAALIKMK